MTKYEMSSNYERWHSATPRAAIRELLQDQPARTIIIEYEGGDVAKWRRVSRNEPAITCIMNSIFSTRNLQPDLRKEAELIYDRLEAEGHLKG